jgi:hypothetical protein
VYNAGTDVLEGDPLGRLLVSFSNFLEPIVNTVWLCKHEMLTAIPRVCYNSSKLRWCQVSAEGVKQRDEMVFQFAKDQNAPVIMLTSGTPSLCPAHPQPV